MDYTEIAQLPNVDQRILTIAAAHGDIVGDWQLRLAEVDRWKVQRRVRSGTMRQLTPSEYACGPSATRQLDDRMRRGLAIVHAGDSPTGLARGTAAAQYRALDRGSRTIHVVTARHVRDLPELGIVYHRSTSIDFDQLHVVEGEPMTHFTRTIADLGFDHTRYQIVRAMCAGRDQGRLDIAALEAVLDSRGGRPGTREVRSALVLLEDGCNGTRGRCEDHLVEGVLRSRILPVPDVCNRRKLGIGGIEADLAWRDVGLVVFADGGPHQWVDVQENDSLQMELLRANGINALRFPNRRIWRNRDSVVAEIERAYIACRGRVWSFRLPWLMSPAGCESPRS